MAAGLSRRVCRQRWQSAGRRQRLAAMVNGCAASATVSARFGRPPAGAVSDTGGRCCGRDFSAGEIRWIRRIAARRGPDWTRQAVSRAVCGHLNWRKPDGGLKDMSARAALLRMHRQGRIELPPPAQRAVPQRVDLTQPPGKPRRATASSAGAHRGANRTCRWSPAMRDFSFCHGSASPTLPHTSSQAVKNVCPKTGCGATAFAPIATRDSGTPR